MQITHPGKDGIVRAVTIKTTKGIITRPIQRLRNLEVLTSVADEPAETDCDIPTPTLTPAPSTPTPLPSSTTQNTQIQTEPLSAACKDHVVTVDTRTTRSGRTVKGRDILNL